MANTYSVYMHKNKSNNKVYIGITCQKPITRRWKNGDGYLKSPFFYKAIKKYGWDNFEHSILYENISKEVAEEKEKELIEKYKSNDRIHGYNIQSGGGVRNLSELTKYKLKIKSTGRKHSEETKKKMSLSHIGKQKCLGYRHTEETKEKHRQLMLGKKNPRSKTIIQYDLDGKFIKTYETMQQAVEELNIKSSCHISDCCRGKRNKCHGYIWKYKEEV